MLRDVYESQKTNHRVDLTFLLKSRSWLLFEVYQCSVVEAHLQDGFKHLHFAFFSKLSSQFPWTISRQELILSLKSGHVQLDSDGCIIGALGLSLRSTMHELSIDGSRLWAWCAFDVIGILGALRVSGLARSVDPCNGENILLEFADGIPQDKNPVVFMADVQSNSALCEGWCSKVNFFTSAQSAEAWRQTNGLTGSVVSVGNLVHVAVKVWSRLLAREEGTDNTLGHNGP
jgi:alkylmercury lyase